MFKTVRYAYHSTRVWKMIDKRNRYFFKGDMKKAKYYGNKADKHQKKVTEILWGKRA